jgi:F0F1-type ATP synthase assembly protein I
MSNQSKNQRNKWLSLISIPIQIGVVVYLFSRIGEWIDQKYNFENNTFKIVFLLLGVFLSMYSVILQVNKINKNE